MLAVFFFAFALKEEGISSTKVLTVFFFAFVLKEEAISSTKTKNDMKLENKKQSAQPSAFSWCGKRNI